MSPDRTGNALRLPGLHLPAGQTIAAFRRTWSAPRAGDPACWGCLPRGSGRARKRWSPPSTATRSDSSVPWRTVSTLRFVGVDHLDLLLERSGLRAVERFGNWDRSPLTASSPEIITLARAR